MVYKSGKLRNLNITTLLQHCMGGGTQITNGEYCKKLNLNNYYNHIEFE